MKQKQTLPYLDTHLYKDRIMWVRGKDVHERYGKLLCYSIPKLRHHMTFHMILSPALLILKVEGIKYIQP